MTTLDVVICTYNPRFDYLNRVLDSLKVQTLNAEIWNLIIIDNNSDNPIEAMIDLTWSSRASIIIEEEKGLCRARIRGIKETFSDLILFIDDDNIIPPDHLEKVLKCSERYENLGVFGSGKIVPEWEIEPEPSVLPYTNVLALKNVDKATWSNNPCCNLSNVFGAGMVVRRDVADAYVEHCRHNVSSLNLGRNGENLMSGEDLEFSYIACKMGYGKGVFPELPIIHLINKERVKASYIIKIYCGNIRSNFILCDLWDLRKISKWKACIAILLGFLRRPNYFSFRLFIERVKTIASL
ncbi:MAG: glycosyltransferase [Akkermansiaceae bacterium]